MIIQSSRDSITQRLLLLACEIRFDRLIERIFSELSAFFCPIGLHISVEYAGRKDHVIHFSNTTPNLKPEQLAMLREKWTANRQATAVAAGRDYIFHHGFSCFGDPLGGVSLLFHTQPSKELEHELKAAIAIANILINQLVLSLNEWTLLPGRRIIRRHIEYMIEHGQDAVCVMFMDIDDFKKTNEAVGYLGGAQLLISLRDILEDSGAFEGGMLGHISGDEFLAAIPLKFRDDIDVRAKMQEIYRALSNPISISGYTTKIGLSIGVSIFPIHGETPDNLLYLAQKCLQKAKSQGKNCYVVHSK